MEAIDNVYMQPRKNKVAGTVKEVKVLEPSLKSKCETQANKSQVTYGRIATWMEVGMVGADAEDLVFTV